MEFNSQSEYDLLSDLDSNQDKRYQKPLYYPYTIGQSSFSLATLLPNWNANVRSFLNSANAGAKKIKIFFHFQRQKSIIHRESAN